LQPCPLWPFPFLERLVDAVLSGKINHPRFAQPKLALEHFERVEQFRYGRPVKYPFHILNLDNRDTDNVLFLKDVRNRIDQLIEFLSTHSSPSSLSVYFLQIRIVGCFGDAVKEKPCVEEPWVFLVQNETVTAKGQNRSPAHFLRLWVCDVVGVDDITVASCVYF
jgi:hypothetical protein